MKRTWMKTPIGPKILSFLSLALFAAWTISASADSQNVQRALDGYVRMIEEAEKTLHLPDIRTDQLQELRSNLDRIRADALTDAAALEPEIKATESQLRQLGEKPEQGEEDPAVAQNRETIGAALAKLRGIEKQLEIVALSAGQLFEKASEIERNLFFRQVFESNRSVLDPVLWHRGATTVGRVFGSLRRAFEDWLTDDPDGTVGDRFWVTMFWLVLSFVGGVGARRLLARFIGPDPNDASPSGLNRLWRVFRGLIVNVLSVTIGFSLAGLGLNSLGHLPPQIQQIGWVVMTGSVFVTSIRALTRGVLAPTLPDWRLAMVSDAKAARLRHLLDLAALIVALGFMLRELGGVVFLPPSFAAPASAFAAGSIAAILTMCLLATRPDEEAPPVFPAERPGGFGWVGRIRIVLWILVAAVAAALVFGYLSLAQFMTVQLVVMACLLATLYLIHNLIDELVETGFGSGRPIGDFLRKTVGLSGTAITRLGLFVSAIGDFLLAFVGFSLIATQWAYNLADFKGWMTTIFFGFSVGGVTISLATIVFALLAFAIGLIVTRLVIRWLDGRILARTRIDRGIRDSIRTGSGYLGFALAALFAFSYAGVDFSNIAIIAGALGVGIGFGLQSIVNNFVSGLILLVERPIKVGDWISVSGGEGYVTQIKVRSTLISTFDNCSVIVPNSSLISEPVRNWTHEDTRGRVKVPFGVSYDSDPERVREIVLECVERVKADGHAILSDPEPQVVFMNFGASSLDFELRIQIPEIDYLLAVASALRFEILAAFRKAGVEIPFSQHDVHFRDIDRLEAALGGEPRSVRKPPAERS